MEHSGTHSKDGVAKSPFWLSTLDKEHFLPPDAVAMLLKKMSALDKMVYEQNGETLLNVICRSPYIGNIEVAKTLLEGTSSNWRGRTSKDGYTPLIQAILTKAGGEVINALIEGMDDSYLEYSTKIINEKRTFSNLSQTVKPQKRTALSIALLVSNVDAARVLVSKMRPKHLYCINKRTNYLFDAILGWSDDTSNLIPYTILVKRLIKNAPSEWISWRNDTKQTALDLLLEKDQRKHSEVILNAISKMSKEDLHVIKDDTTYLIKASESESCSVEVLEALIEDAPLHWVNYQSKTSFLDIFDSKGYDLKDDGNDNDNCRFKIPIPGAFFKCPCGVTALFQMIKLPSIRDERLTKLILRLIDSFTNTDLFIYFKREDQVLQSNKRIQIRSTYLIEAALNSKCHSSIIQTLLNRNPPVDWITYNSNGHSALQLMLSRNLIDGLNSGDTGGVDTILEMISKYPPEDLCVTMRLPSCKFYGKTYLHLAADYQCDLIIFEAILEKSMSEWVNKESKTLVHSALGIMLGCHASVMENLILSLISKMNKSMLYTIERHKKMATYLHCAMISKCSVRIVEALLENAPMEWILSEGTLPYDFFDSNIPFAKLEKVLNSIDKGHLYEIPERRSTYLMIAARHGNTKAACYILNDAPLTYMSTQDNFGKTFLHQLILKVSYEPLEKIWNMVPTSIKEILDNNDYTASMLILESLKNATLISNCLNFLKYNEGITFNPKRKQLSGLIETSTCYTIPVLVKEQAVQLMWILDTSPIFEECIPLVDEDVYKSMHWLGVVFKQGPLSSSELDFQNEKVPDRRMQRWIRISGRYR